jgi:cyclophilin family peptidyl-prolyl cis-trans isomerase
MKQPLQRLLITLLLAGLSIGHAWAESVKVEMKTSLGTIVLELDREKAPKSVDNFLQYARDGFYNGTIFHRVIKNFMIQGGGFTGDMTQRKTRSPIENEAKNGLKNSRGTIAMARTSAPHSATSQFFINHKDNDFLNHPGQDGWGYAVFGKVTEGMSVVDAIAAKPTGMQGHMRDVPKLTVVIESVKIIE